MWRLYYLSNKKQNYKAPNRIYVDLQKFTSHKREHFTNCDILSSKFNFIKMGKTRLTPLTYSNVCSNARFTVHSIQSRYAQAEFIKWSESTLRRGRRSSGTKASLVKMLCLFGQDGPALFSYFRQGSEFQIKRKRLIGSVRRLKNETHRI